jgi:anti-sigma regulatory factor (Ser/Thr protein kinase)
MSNISDATPKSFRMTLVNQVDEISKLEGYIEEIASSAGIDPALSMSLNLALEEAVTNVVLYAYPEGQTGEADILTTVADGVLTFVISDSGVPFDPTKDAKKADITLSAEDRPIGGLGVFLVKEIMDTVSYQRTDGKNVLTLTKTLVSGE